MKRTSLIAVMVAALVAFPAVAWGQTDDPATDESDRAASVDFDEAQDRVLEAVDKRVAALERALIEVAESEHLTEEHAAILTADYEFHRDGLLELRPEIEAATTAEELRSLAERVWKEHWVFALQIPKGRLTHAADLIVDAAAKADAVASEFGDALDQLEAMGIDVEEGRRLLNELSDHVADAADRAAPVPDAVLPIEVTEMPDANTILDQARTDIRTAHDRMLEARDTAHELAAFIRTQIGR